MELLVDRRWPKDTYTIGRFFINGRMVCNTLEDADRGLNQYDPLQMIKETKLPGETAIPKGRYRVRMDVVSPKYNAIQYYRNLTEGKMPRLERVPGFEGILIHPGNSPEDTYGCILVGANTIKGRITNSRYWFETIYREMRKASDAGEEIWITIK